MKVAYKPVRIVFSILAMVSIACSGLAQESVGADPAIVGEETAILTQAPKVPPPITRTNAAKVIVTLEVREVTRQLSEGVSYTVWTFGGEVPGSFIRVREGDLVEFHLNNHPNNKMPHNIDLHAVTGPGGGAMSSFTAPGHGSQFSFRALNPGLFIYHCASAPVPMHVANGMYGLIFVQPKEGMPKVDREYYIMQSEFYTSGKFGEEGLQSFSMEKALDERPSYVVFNGAVNSTVGDKAIKANVGERVRLFVGNAGLNLISSFHVIGAVFDTVYREGGITSSEHNIATTLIPAGGAAIVDFKAQVPGVYSIVDHSLTRAFNKGALAELKIEGQQNSQIYSGKQAETVYAPPPVPGENEPKVASTPTPPANTSKPAPTKEIQLEQGKRVFMQSCFACHQPNGRGLPGVYPPLAGSDFLMADKERSIRIALNGLAGPVVVNGKVFSSAMPSFRTLTDEQIANVLTYVRNSWGNSGDAVTADEVRKVRASGGAVHP